ncbi:restriction endonuclease subunit S [Veillonella parvula]|uniref:restriction endonuclease subunit S n=1 Tax=Veillonella parvula TaxID=29466 RepID=UPI0012BAD87B|nr:restriction endonuclease subunit S [Veillonella parvula]MTH26968.1 restriction endonuclease subunit S [Veillonella parvula]MTH56807.1 restriction endonuclease subunit S [Veillonella parvula]
MSKEKRRVPKLRFPGFTEDWEQRKLGDIATLSKGNGYSKSDLSASGNPIILYGRLYTNYETTIRNVDTFVKLKDKSVISQGGEVIVPASGETAEDISRASVVKNQGVIIGGDLNVIKVNILLDPTFLALTISNGEQQKELSKRAQGKSVVHLHNSDLQEVNLIFPLLNEQRKISTLFEKMDNIITLHQRKLNNLKLKKKALLQKLFPKNGERYPELRFPGFTDAWEQRKLNEFLSVSNLKNAENKYNKKDVLSVSGDYGIVNQIDFQGRSFAGASVSNYGVVEKGDIVYTKSPLKLNPYGIIKTNRLNNGIVSTLYAIYKTKENCDSKFIEHYFNLDSRLNQYLKPLVNKGAKNDMKVSSENALIGEVCFPKITEQVLIADLLDCLDIYITLHQRKLDHLQLQKKALLQQMFV